MADEKLVKLDETTMTYLKRISDGVMVILWLLVSAISFWPLVMVTSAYTDSGDATTISVIVALVIAIGLGYGVTRLVFPIEYTSANAKASSEE